MTPTSPLLLPRFLRAAIGFAAMGVLAACSGTPDPARTPEGIWTGALVTDQGACPTERPSTLQINAHDISFTPADGSVVLKGERGSDNTHFRARAETKGADGKPYPLVFDGYPVGQAIGGMYGTPSCRAHVTMTRPER